MCIPFIGRPELAMRQALTLFYNCSEYETNTEKRGGGGGGGGGRGLSQDYDG